MKLLLLLGSLLMLVSSTDVGLVGNWGYTINSEKITITGEKINNYSEYGTSGTLKVSLHLSKDYISNGTSSASFNSWVLLSKTFDPLKPNYYYHDLDFSGSWENSPPAGSYYVYLCLSEYDGGDYHIIDFMKFDKQYTVEYGDDDDDW